MPCCAQSGRVNAKKGPSRSGVGSSCVPIIHCIKVGTCYNDRLWCWNGISQNMRLSRCTQCEVKLGPRNATLGSEMCNKCRMQEVGIPQRDDVQTSPESTASSGGYHELIYELRPAATQPDYWQLVCELRPATEAPSGLASVGAGD